MTQGGQCLDLSGSISLDGAVQLGPGRIEEAVILEPSLAQSHLRFGRHPPGTPRRLTPPRSRQASYLGGEHREHRHPSKPRALPGIIVRNVDEA